MLKKLIVAAMFVAAVIVTDTACEAGRVRVKVNSNRTVVSTANGTDRWNFWKRGVPQRTNVRVRTR
jgi:hypothetical protein